MALNCLKSKVRKQLVSHQETVHFFKLSNKNLVSWLNVRNDFLFLKKYSQVNVYFSF